MISCHRQYHNSCRFRCSESVTMLGAVDCFLPGCKLCFNPCLFTLHCVIPSGSLPAIILSVTIKVYCVLSLTRNLICNGPACTNMTKHKLNEFWKKTNVAFLFVFLYYTRIVSYHKAPGEVNIHIWSRRLSLCVHVSSFLSWLFLASND